MAISDQEAVASLKVLVSVAKADGVIAPEEREAIEAALEGVTLEGATRQSLFEEDIDLSAELAKLQSDEAKEQAYSSAYSLAYADGECHPDEQKMLDQIKQALNVGDEKVTLLQRIYGETKDTVLLSNIKKIDDPEKRAKEVKEDILKYSIGAGVLGAFPIPGIAIATDLAAVAIQIKMVRDVGMYYGFELGNKDAKGLLGAVGLGTGARIAVNNLAKFVPGWGVAFAITSNFASTWALGKIAVQYFESGCKADFSTLKDAFKKAEKEGKSEYKAHKGDIEAKKKENEAALGTLNDDLKAGKITQDEYEKKVAELS